eukprot:TRINITY_DN1745_c5_g1_i1.p1 TRINITY_DN1745_c5_g1~~TRINITY_DN1745_c5_g1_i1.p1  ORF type:complete len:591 (+),score=246.23 TRINITY_DN1745_c5_g1_i1:69-1841(+)
MAGAGEGGRVRTCYYEVLGVARDSDSGELRTAYRRLALKWHPDKNSHRAEEATRVFKEIQNAYEVLSDANERAWYDAHRESILRGGDGKEDEDGSAFLVNVWPFFQSSCHNGYDESLAGNFYEVYAELFREIGTSEESGNESSTYLKTMPPFGHSDSPWEDVARFYSQWLAFSSRHKFMWVDKWKLSEAPNRRVKRLMEKDNGKMREKARKEYNELIRSLVMYVRKRDPRVKQHAEEAAVLEEERRRAHAERKREQAKEEAEKFDALEEEMIEFEEEQWATYQKEMRERGMDDQLFGDGGAMDMETGLVDDTFCIACKKRFKSAKALANHEKSKKHIENFERLRASVAFEEEEEEGEESDDEEEGELDDDGEHGEEEDEEELDEDVENENDEGGAQEDDGDDLESGGEDGEETADTEEAEGDEEDKDSEDEMDEYLAMMAQREAKKAKKKNKKKKNVFGMAPVDLDSVVPHDNKDVGDGDVAPDVEEPESESAVDSADAASETSDVCSELGDDKDSDGGGGRKKKKRRRKKQAQEVVEEAPPPSEHSELECGICHREFPTRNKLFAHIRDTGHAELKGPGGKKKKKGKRR